mgnify:CR=1 FL=1
MKYAAITTETAHIPGDERSRTNPGHGYPAHTVTHKTFTEFDDREEMVRWVEARTGRRFTRDFTIIKYEPVQVQERIEIID